MAQQKNRIEEIDYLRGFAILAVIAIHTSWNFTKIPNVNFLLIMNVIIDVFSHFAVPLFIFISGFVLSLNYDSLLSRKSFYKKRAESIIPQYMIFSVLYILLSITISAINGKLESPSIIEIMFNLFTANSSSHLWYFALIIQLYILYPYIIKEYQKFVNSNNAFSFLFITLIIQQAWIMIKNIAKTYFSSINYFNSIDHFNSITDIVLQRVFLSHIFYFLLGVYVCQNYRNVKDQILKAKRWILSIILIFTGVISFLWIKGIVEYGSYYRIPEYYFIATGLVESIYFSLISIMFIPISLSYSKKKNSYSNAILSLGKYSFGIYLIHILYMRIIVEIIYPQFSIGPTHWIFYPILFISTLLLSYFSVSQIVRLPYSEVIIGVKNSTFLAKTASFNTKERN